MSVITADAKVAGAPHSRPVARPSALTAWITLAGRRLALSAHTPREVLAPLATPILFALVIAPALAKMIPTAGHDGVDYRTFVIVGTVGLLIPLTCAFAGIGVIVDRTSGARRELLAAPVPRGLIVAGNLTVAVLTSALQVGVLTLAGWVRGASFDVTGTGVAWFVAAVLTFTIFMYSVAEILAILRPLPRQVGQAATVNAMARVLVTGMSGVGPPSWTNFVAVATSRSTPTLTGGSCPTGPGTSAAWIGCWPDTRT
jgi:hypothetical protein